MEDGELVKLAKEYCTYYHKGKFRKGSNQPYSVHPIEVAQVLEKYGYNDTVTQCIALLHDLVEDTEIITTEIKKRFGYEISNGVYILSKNTISHGTIGIEGVKFPIDIEQLSGEQMYRLRLAFARRTVIRVKIADMIHNTRDLKSLVPESIKKKIDEAKEFYIPIGRKVAPLMTRELEENIDSYGRGF